MTTHTRSAASILRTCIENKAPDATVSQAFDQVVQALGGSPWLLSDMTNEGRLLYLIALTLENG